MSKKSNFNNIDLYVSGKPLYPYIGVGQFGTNRVFTYSDELKLNSQDNSDCFYAGEPVQYVVENNTLTVKTVTNTETDLKTIKFDAVIIPYTSTYLNMFDKSNKNIGYRVFNKGTYNTIKVAALNNDMMNVKTTVSLDPNTKVTFTFDENGVLCVKNAEAGDRVYGISQNTDVTNANEIVVVEFNFKSTETIPVSND